MPSTRIARHIKVPERSRGDFSYPVDYLGLAADLINHFSRTIRLNIYDEIITRSGRRGWSFRGERWGRFHISSSKTKSSQMSVCRRKGQKRKKRDGGVSKPNQIITPVITGTGTGFLLRDRIMWGWSNSNNRPGVFVGPVFVGCNLNILNDVKIPRSSLEIRDVLGIVLGIRIPKLPPQA